MVTSDGGRRWTSGAGRRREMSGGPISGSKGSSPSHYSPEALGEATSLGGQAQTFTTSWPKWFALLNFVCMWEDASHLVLKNKCYSINFIFKPSHSKPEAGSYVL